jgi:hypothetical protein
MVNVCPRGHAKHAESGCMRARGWISRACTCTLSTSLALMQRRDFCSGSKHYNIIHNQHYIIYAAHRQSLCTAAEYIIYTDACSQSASVNWLASEWVMMHLSLKAYRIMQKLMGGTRALFQSKTSTHSRLKQKSCILLTLKYSTWECWKMDLSDNFKVKVCPCQQSASSKLWHMLINHFKNEQWTWFVF